MDAESQPNYQLFKEWFVQNGGLFHKIQFPVRFPPLDYIGVAAAQDIKANQTFLAVPKKLIISVTKVRDSALGSVLSQYKSLSDPDNEQTEFNILALYLIWQKMLGKVSFFYPYLQAVEKASTIMQWPDEDIRRMKDPYITVELVEELRSQFPPIYKQFHALSVVHPELFREPISWQLFMDCYAIVMTRCFGWGLPQTMMVPFADFLNHNSGGVNHYALSKKLEESSSEYEKYKKQYVRKRKQIDLTLVGIDNRAELPISYMRNARQKFIHDHQKMLTPDVITHPYNPLQRLCPQTTRQHLEAIHKQLIPQSYDVPLYPSSNSEDNDTQQQSQLEQKKRLFARQLKRLSRQEIEHRFQEPKPMANSQFEDDVTFGWWQQLSEDQTFFIMVAERNVKKGTQIFNSYGRRSNRFLLIWYGFTHFQNKYDSVSFRLLDHQSSLKSGKLVFVKYITERELETAKEAYENLNITDEFRLKRDNLCYQLMTYLRLRIARSTQPYSDLHKKKLLPLHKISNLQLEKIALNTYLTILRELQKEYFVGEVRQQLSNRFHDYFSYILIESNQQILRNHTTGVKMLMSMVEKVASGSELLEVYRNLGTSESEGEEVKEEMWRRRKFILDYVKGLGAFLERKSKK